MAVTMYALHLDSGKLTTVSLAYGTTLYADRSTDTIYAPSYKDAVALFSATSRTTGTWSRTVVLPKYDTFSWLFVESEFTDSDGVTAASVAVTIADTAGNTLASMTVSTRDPVRLPAFRERELVLTVSSKARVTEVLLASSSEELKNL